MVSSLKINLAKSEFFHIGEVDNNERSMRILGCVIGTLPASYLGLPLGTNFKSKVMWDLMIERIALRLDS